MGKSNEIDKSNKIKIIVITALIFLVSIVGISYAYFTIQVVGNETASSIGVTAVKLSLVYNDVQIVSGEYARPGWTQTKTLTVTNNGSATVNYNIIWRDLYNEVINNELVISGTCSSTSGSCPTITETVVPTTTPEGHNINIKKNIEIPVGATHTYTVTAEFKDTGSNQNYNQNKQFHGTLNIAEGSTSVASEESTSAMLSLLTDTGATGLSTGDIVTVTKSGIDNQDFYVVSTNSTKTVLLAKYNLLVGNLFDYDFENDILTWIKTYSSQDEGYGLQNSAAKGITNASQIVATPFSAINYWYDEINDDLYSTYGTLSNAANDVYNSSYSSVALSIDHSDPTDIIINENNYSIAYYVEEYVNRLGINGTGRLLTVAEAVSLGCTRDPDNNCLLAPSWLNNETSYWLGSVSEEGSPYSIWYDSSFAGDDFTNYYAMGVRPVIEINTSDIHSS